MQTKSSRRKNRQGAVYTFKEEGKSLSYSDLVEIQLLLESRGVACRLLDLRQESRVGRAPAAFVLLAENAHGALGGDETALWRELKTTLSKEPGRWKFRVTTGEEEEKEKKEKETEEEKDGAEREGREGEEGEEEEGEVIRVLRFPNLPQLNRVRMGLGQLGVGKLAALRNAEVFLRENSHSTLPPTQHSFQPNWEQNERTDKQNCLEVGVCLGQLSCLLEWQALEKGEARGEPVQANSIYFLGENATGCELGPGFSLLHFRLRSSFDPAELLRNRSKPKNQTTPPNPAPRCWLSRGRRASRADERERGSYRYQY